MNVITHSHRHCEAIINSNPLYLQRWNEFYGALMSITDTDIINDFNTRKLIRPSLKSVTPSINEILKQKMLAIPGWSAEVDIFNDTTGAVTNSEWRLDFACETFAVEVAFNHQEAVAWNLIKPTLCGELNHVQKAQQTELGIYVCATNNMKRQGNIDSASGSYERVMRTIPAMMNQLTIPMMIIGLDSFNTFHVDPTTKTIMIP